MNRAASLPHPIPRNLAEVIAERLRSIAEPMRIRALDTLRDGDRTIQQLADGLQTSQQNMSKHIAVLRSQGIVATRKHGTSTRVSISDPMVFDICSAVCDGVKAHHSAMNTILLGGAPTEPSA